MLMKIMMMIILIIIIIMWLTEPIMVLAFITFSNSWKIIADLLCGFIYYYAKVLVLAIHYPVTFHAGKNTLYCGKNIE